MTTRHHPYTIGLFGSIPSLDEEADRLKPIQGLMPDPTDLPEGCAFAAPVPLLPRSAADRKQSRPATLRWSAASPSGACFVSAWQNGRRRCDHGSKYDLEVRAPEKVF